MTTGAFPNEPQVALPPKDDTLAPGVFNEGTPGPRWFDFTGAPGVAGFNPSSCPAQIQWGGSESFHLRGCECGEHLLLPCSFGRTVRATTAPRTCRDDALGGEDSIPLKPARDALAHPYVREHPRLAANEH